MATNVEIKARVANPVRLEQRVRELSDTPVELVVQEDAFFLVSRGRLKLRVYAPDRGELIFYERADMAGPKTSNYLICSTPNPAALRTVLEAALGLRGVVRKRRKVFKVGNTRIHLDEVEGLGTFMELEVVLGPGQSLQEGQAVAEELKKQLGIDAADLVERAYIDLLSAAGSDLTVSKQK